MYLKILKDVTSAALPSRTKRGTHEMSNTLEVNGAATDASASDRAIPEENVKITFLEQKLSRTEVFANFKFRINFVCKTYESFKSPDWCIIYLHLQL